MSREAGRRAVGGKRVEEDVGRRVVGLSGCQDEAAGRGEHDESGEVGVPGQFVQVPGSYRLGAEDGVEPIGGEAADQAAVGDRRRVDDAAQRVCGVDPGEQGGQGVAVGHIAGGDPDLGAEACQLGGQCLGTGCVPPAPAGQEEVAHAVLGDEVACDECAEAAGASGDQDRAVGVPRGGPCGLRGSGASQPRYPRLAAAQGGFGLAGRDHGGESGLGRAGLVLDVEEVEPAGVLGLCGAYQSPYRGLGGVHVLAGEHGHGAPGDDDEGGGARFGVGEPVAYLTEHLPGEGAHGVRDALAVGRRRAVQDGVRGGAAGVLRARLRPLPDDPVEGCGRRPRGCRQLLRRDGAGDERLDRGHRCAALVGDHDGGHLVAAYPLDVDA